MNLFQYYQDEYNQYQYENSSEENIETFPDDQPIDIPEYDDNFPQQDRFTPFRQLSTTTSGYYSTSNKTESHQRQTDDSYLISITTSDEVSPLIIHQFEQNQFRVNIEN